MMWWAMWCAAVLARSAVSAPLSDTMSAIDLSQLDTPTPDDDGISFGEAPMDARYGSNIAPWMYPLARTQRPGAGGERRPRLKRKMPSLSINNPMEVLRQRLLQEVVRKQMREANQRQAFANRLFLQNVGKRGYWTNSGSNHYDRYDE